MHGGSIFGAATIPLLILFIIVASCSKKHFHVRFKHLRWSLQKYCPVCQQYRTFKRISIYNLGVITIILLILTGGKWLIAMLFYPKRCETCGLKVGKASFFNPLTELGIQKFKR